MMFWDELQKGTLISRDIHEVNDTLECFKQRLSTFPHRGSSVLVSVDSILSEIGLFSHIMSYLTEIDSSADWLQLKLYSSTFAVPQTSRSYIPFAEFFSAFRDQSLRNAMLLVIKESNTQKERSEQVTAQQEISEVDTLTMMAGRRRRKAKPPGT
eukprot:TRINITY_DN30645_c0_g1_i1.p1 TRINITY_DN30645_c0_g1~~TRINITY_DN30645_c0_g1_i1.p1  ORF type:complete len:155 (+),score=31.14 TRINITY_DN30645_c0_g1_i1:407-871(+)